MGFRTERLKAGKSVKDVMKMLDVTDACVYQWETGVSAPRAEKLIKLATFYGCSIEALLTDNSIKRSVQ